MRADVHADTTKLETSLHPATSTHVIAVNVENVVGSDPLKDAPENDKCARPATALIVEGIEPDMVVEEP